MNRLKNIDKLDIDIRNIEILLSPAFNFNMLLQFIIIMFNLTSFQYININYSNVNPVLQ